MPARPSARRSDDGTEHKRRKTERKKHKNPFRSLILVLFVSSLCLLCSVPSRLTMAYTNGWRTFRTILLAPTWGFPLTSVSLFFFLPFDLYFEFIGDVLFLISKI